MTASPARPCRVCLTLLATCAQAAFSAPTIVVGTVTGLDGAPLPTRVLIATLDWKQSQVAFTDAKGRYRLPFQAGKSRLSVSRGPEYATAGGTVDLPSGRVRFDFSLKPVLDMGACGWYGGDVHLHSTAGQGAQPPAAIARAARCEGLDWAVLTDVNSTAGLQEWLAQRTPHFVPLPGQEIATSRGHLLALGASRPISADTSNGASDVFRICTEIHAQGALAVLAHPLFPGMAYRDWDLRACDGIEILNGTLPPYSFGFDMLQGRLKWQGLLDAGQRVAALGGSDSRDVTGAPLRRLLANPRDAARKHPRVKLLLRAIDARTAAPFARAGNYPGSVRTYVHCTDLTPEGIIAALRSGMAFVTTGPLLIATVEGRGPGQTVPLGDSKAVRITVEAASGRRLERLDIVADGEVIKSISAAPSTRLTETFELGVAGRSWLTIECRGPWPDIAVTNPWRLKT